MKILDCMAIALGGAVAHGIVSHLGGHIMGHFFALALVLIGVSELCDVK